MRKIASQQVLCADKIDDINYKVVKLLASFVPGRVGDTEQLYGSVT